MIVRGYVDHAVRRVRDAVEGAVDALWLARADLAAAPSKRVRDEVHDIAETYFMGMVEDHVLAAMHKMYADEDKAAHQQLRRLQRLPSGATRAKVLGVERGMDCPLPEALHEFDRLEKARTPLEKLTVLHDSISLVTYAVQRHQPGATVTSDELIPLVCSLLVQSAPADVFSALEYIEAFMPRGAASSEAGYALVSFRAALSVVTSAEMQSSVRDLAVSSPELKKPGRKNARMPMFGRSVTGVSLQVSGKMGKPQMARSSSTSAPGKRVVSAAPPLRWGVSSDPPAVIGGEESDLDMRYVPFPTRVCRVLVF